MKRFKIIYFLIAFGFSLTSCSDDDDVNLAKLSFAETDYISEYRIQVFDTLSINPQIRNSSSNTQYAWYLNDTMISEDSHLNYEMTTEGTFNLLFRASESLEQIERTYTVIVEDNYTKYFRPITGNSSPFITKVLTYKPAPGQFLNTAFASEEAAESIVGGMDGLVSLGAWGGYIEFMFDHTIENIPSEKDFVIFANAFDGSSEPGIVQVSFDENGNGIADDTWYEIAGDAHFKDEVIRNYEVTYFNPNGAEDIPFIDNQGNEGALRMNVYHDQPYYPAFIPEQESITFKGTKVYAPFYVNDQGWVTSDNLEYGYVDNFSEEFSDYRGNTIDLDWAVNELMQPVELRGIDFVRVYTGSFDQSDVLGEMSTEIAGAANLVLYP
ncbi:hypothetical protein GO491_07120 [Flavobacteriaceae bacterium Ap0902]|nr:hypothetical protein [Flavobacteriaceae bacterium Ap0902]